VFSADLRPVAELSESEIATWRELSDSAVEPNPFGDPDFVLPMAHELRPDNLAILVVSEEGDWVCCLPVTRARRWRRGGGTAVRSSGST
jgi:CelD/BcsL family acetyltransferase involved in cellulose biosynthesis